MLKRRDSGTLRTLPSESDGLVDFSSNDYFGLARFPLTVRTSDPPLLMRGSGGSRLLGGNSSEMERLEEELAVYYGSPDSLVFNSGYDANLGLLSSIPGKGDWVLYDERVHASIRDGLRLSLSRSHKFRHNDLEDLSRQLTRILRRPDFVSGETLIYVVTESVFSMDGDSPDLDGMLGLCRETGALLLLDEAHRWEVHDRDLPADPWRSDPHLLVRLVTFGKAMGLHGAAVLCSSEIKQYLVNFARSFIYTTALPEEQAYRLREAHGLAAEGRLQPRVLELRERIAFFAQESTRLGIDELLIEPGAAIQCLILGDIERTRELSHILSTKGFFVKPIWAPTVPAGSERLRICLNSLHTFAELEGILGTIAGYLSE